jgi:predicted PurR-regulated permease PerM
MQSSTKEKKFFYIFLGVSALIVGIIFWPFAPLLFVAIAFAVVLNPVYLWMSRRTKGRSWLASLLTVLLLIIVLGIPLFFLGTNVFIQSQSLYLSVTEGNGAVSAISGFSTFIQTKVPLLAGVDLKTLFGGATTFLSGTLKVIFATTLSTAFSIVLTLFSVFYFLKDGEQWKRWIVRLSPLSDQHDDRIISMLVRAINGVMLGYVFIALVQGLLMGLGLWFFGVPNAALWGTLAGIASMIPSVGTALVSVPAVIFLFSTGATASAIGLLLWALLLVGSIDNVLNPIVVGKSIELPPIAVLFSVLGGIALLGAPGIIIGPLAVSLLRTLIAIYHKDFEEK